jgi:two-component system, sporulation sensor kinase D
MVFGENRNILKGLMVLISLIIVLMILYNTYTFFQYFKEEERNKMILYAEAQKTLNTSDLDVELNLSLSIIRKNTTIPTVLTDKNDVILSFANIDKDEIDSKQEEIKVLNQLKFENEPIILKYDNENYTKVYYGNSNLIKTLKYYPILLLIVILLFILLILNYYKTNKFAAQNLLWAGMAKETAHQIATPLSSLIGWLELLKLENINPSYAIEIEKDIHRLQNITDRFSKIGSDPILKKTDIVSSTSIAFNYLKQRYEGKVIFEFLAPDAVLIVQINEVLHSWTIENLIKNAIDAMKGVGKISLKIIEKNENIQIVISDTGKGILKKDLKKIFETGYTTKKRGWGLGLSLTKRIVVNYHKGKIYVAHSQINKGTTFVIELKKG